MQPEKESCSKNECIFAIILTIIAIIVITVVLTVVEEQRMANNITLTYNPYRV